ncbi:MAG: dTDP-4-dehydrorhamnose 3,5-epimerase [Acidobacteria bacterium]|nr:dTDP-4-dehydrorhamnose 3,5-epimerase [Acidobacteriota bacterium]
MGFHIESTHLGDVVALVADAFHDERGNFMETFRSDIFRQLGLPGEFVQDNQAFSTRGVIRGLHFQWDPPMAKLMRVVTGSAFLVAVDIRKNSPTRGKWFGIEASSESRRLVWAPAGFARGLCVTSECAYIQYKCTSLYNPKGEAGIRFDDPDIGVEWPGVTPPILSKKDRTAMSYAEWMASPLSDHFKL